MTTQMSLGARQALIFLSPSLRRGMAGEVVQEHRLFAGLLLCDGAGSRARCGVPWRCHSCKSNVLDSVCAERSCSDGTTGGCSGARLKPVMDREVGSQVGGDDDDDGKSRTSTIKLQ